MTIGDTSPKIAVVIPAYNEAARIRAVLDPVIASGLFHDVVVVDDGSDDGTAVAAASCDCVRVVCTPRNLGKGGAVQTGLATTDADIVCMIDADLVGLRPGHLSDLVSPLLEDEGLHMTVGQFVGGRKRTDWAQGLVKSISGQRAMRRALLASLPDLANCRFGVETVISKHARIVGARVELVQLEGLTQVMKEEKVGVTEGVKERLKMYADIAEHKLPAPVRRSLSRLPRRGTRAATSSKD